MRDEDRIEYNDLLLKKTEIISRQILLYFCDFFRYVLPLFDTRNIYRVPLKEYDRFRDKDRLRFSHELYRLKKNGMVKKYIDEKGSYLELTNKGRNQLRSYLTEDLEVKEQEKWDKKWRIVIFDVPNDKKNEREVLRNKLQILGLIKLQESVYIYPFDCLNEINIIKSIYLLRPHVQYIVADRVETELDLIKIFIDNGVLKDKML